jgi:hypothetical protein
VKVTGSIVFNLIVSIIVVAGLAAVCRLAHIGAGSWLDEHAGTLEQLARREIEDRKAA